MTIPKYSTPIVDDQNPCYCPDLPAASFLESLRQKTTSEPAFRQFQQYGDPLDLLHAADDYEPLCPSFEKLLDQSISEDDLLRLVYRRPTPPSPEEGSSLGSIYSVPARHAQYLRSAPRQEPSMIFSDSFSDLQGPLKHERSILAVNEGSFELSAKAERIQYFPTNYKPGFTSVHKNRRYRVHPDENDDWNTHLQDLCRKVRQLEDDLYGPPVGTESPRGIKHFISHLDQLLPGTRLKEKLNALDARSHQRIADILAGDGNLDARVLNLLRQSEIESLDLTESAVDDYGLNLGAQDLLQVLGKPNSFLFLGELNLSGMQLCDGDIMHIHHLPRLSRLWLGSSGISNEAIYLLTSLKRTLTDLDIAYNPRINDDAIPALLILGKLEYLSLLDTGVTISGVRRLAATLDKTGRLAEVEVPAACEQYLNRMHQKYWVSPVSPMITDPAAVPHLSGSALKRNLAAHAVYNPEISTEGSQSDLANRLGKLLETRRNDLLVRKLIWQKST